MLSKIRRYFNPTFKEWLGDCKIDFEKELSKLSKEEIKELLKYE
jgi:hypothetical protein